jgi:CheY-like chemotaxis protein
MVVDDEEDILQVLRLAFDMGKYPTETFANPLEALQKFKGYPESFSLLLIDIRIAPMDGIELAHELLKIQREAKIIFVTAFDMNDEIREKLQTLPRYGIIRKPFSVQVLCDLVKSSGKAADL